MEQFLDDSSDDKKCSDWSMSIGDCLFKIIILVSFQELQACSMINCVYLPCKEFRSYRWSSRWRKHVTLSRSVVFFCFRFSALPTFGWKSLFKFVRLSVLLSICLLVYILICVIRVFFLSVHTSVILSIRSCTRLCVIACRIFFSISLTFTITAYR